MRDNVFFKSVFCGIAFVSIIIIAFLLTNVKKAVFINEPVSNINTALETTVGICSNDNDSGIQSCGNGVAVSENGYIVTNYSVIGNMHNKIEVTLSDGKKVFARTVWKNEVYDIAIIKAECSFENIMTFADTKKLTMGERIYTTGVLSGLQFRKTMSEGIVSGLYRTIADCINGEDVLIEDLIQTDISPNVTGRGGALIDVNGNLLGIMTIKNNTMYAVPINIISPIIEALSRNGFVRNIDLGIYCYDNDMMSYLSQSGKGTDGVTAVYVKDGGAAQKSGIMTGDTIIGINGKNIKNMIEFYEIINASDIDGELNLQVQRSGKSLKIKILGTQLQQNS